MKWFRVVAVIASAVLLIGATNAQVRRQRDIMSYEIANAGYALIGRARATHTDESARSQAINALRWFATPTRRGLYIIVMVFHVEHTDEYPIASVQSPLTETRRHAYLEERVYEAAQGFADGTRGSFFISTRRIDMVFAESMVFDSDYIFVWAAEAFPLCTAMRQLIPIYIMTALLLTALFIPRKKQSPKEN